MKKKPLWLRSFESSTNLMRRVFLYYSSSDDIKNAFAELAVVDLLRFSNFSIPKSSHRPIKVEISLRKTNKKKGKNVVWVLCDKVWGLYLVDPDKPVNKTDNNHYGFCAKEFEKIFGFSLRKCKRPVPLVCTIRKWGDT